MNRLRKWHDVVIERFRDNPEAARDYLEVALAEYREDGDREALLLALRTVAEARGGVSALAERTGMNRQSLYKALSPQGNPRLDTLQTVLHGLGYRISLEPIGAA